MTNLRDMTTKSKDVQRVSAREKIKSDVLRAYAAGMMRIVAEWNGLDESRMEWFWRGWGERMMVARNSPQLRSQDDVDMAARCVVEQIGVMGHGMPGDPFRRGRKVVYGEECTKILMEYHARREIERMIDFPPCLSHPDGWDYAAYERATKKAGGSADMLQIRHLQRRQRVCGGKFLSGVPVKVTAVVGRLVKERAEKAKNKGKPVYIVDGKVVSGFEWQITQILRKVKTNEEPVYVVDGEVVGSRLDGDKDKQAAGVSKPTQCRGKNLSSKGLAAGVKQ